MRPERSAAENYKRTSNIVLFVVRFAKEKGWKANARKSRSSESWYVWLRNGPRSIRLRVSMHACRKGWKTVGSYKQAEQFLRVAMRERS